MVGKKETEITNKSHKVRRALIAGICLATVGVLGLAGYIVAVPSATLLAINAGVFGLAATIIVSSSVIINKLHEVRRVSGTKKSLVKSMEKIKKLSSEGSKVRYSDGYYKKILKNHAKKSLYLTKQIGSLPVGELRSTSGVSHIQGARLVNQIDAYGILRDISTSALAVRKYERKIRGLTRDLSKIQDASGDVVTRSRWARTYSLGGATVVDRRIGIQCLTTTAKDEFKDIFSTPCVSEGRGNINIYVRFNEEANIAPTIARTNDEKSITTIKRILIKDVLEACKELDSETIKSLFPLTIERRNVNPKLKTKVDTIELVIRSYGDLQAAVKNIDNGRE